MCGIAGWFSPDGEVEARVLTGMRDRMVHRGPDGAGTWVSGDHRVGLAHRRLSIVDLSDDGAQPMHAMHEGRRLSVVFNGEIYNHVELRCELEELGAVFASDHSDTEVLLHGYVTWGLEGMLGRLVGMYAFCLWDEGRRQAYLVRDPLGIKPLYVTERERGFCFASEIKAFTADPRFEARLDEESFRHYLSFRAVPAPGTLFQGVQCVAPGELWQVDVDSGSWVRRRYWDALANADQDGPTTLEDAHDRLEELLCSSVEHRLRADVPVGVFLSGGVDSAYLLDQAAERVRNPHTYTVVYPGHERYDEGADARERAEAAEARHREVPVDELAFGRTLARVAYHQDEPIAAPVCTSVYFLSEAARASNVPVVLAGEGADEIFVGYRRWIQMRDLERWNQRLPDLPGRLMRRGLAAGAGGLMDWLSPHAEILRRAGRGQPLFWSGAMDYGEQAKQRLLGPALANAQPPEDSYGAVIEPLRRRFLEQRSAADITGWMTYVDLCFRLPQLMLPRLDKMGMAFSVEGRVPFLDHRIVEFVCGLPPELRGGKGKTPKGLFKSVAARRLPRDFVYREKRGFQAPVREWKATGFGARYLPALRTFAQRTGLFDPGALEQLLAREGDRLYFNLTNFMLWHLIYVEDVLDGSLEEVSEMRAIAGARAPSGTSVEETVAA